MTPLAIGTRTVALVAVLLLAGCGGDESAAPTTATDQTTSTVTEETTTTVSEPEESPGDFLENIFVAGLRGQHGRVYDLLHPVHQEVVTRSRFEECRSELLEDVAVEFESFDVLEVYDDPVGLPEIPEKTSKAVTYRITVRSGNQTQPITDTGHAVQVGDHWVWVLQRDDYRAYKAGDCPT